MNKKVRVVTLSQVLKINQILFENDNNKYLCYGEGKIESALHSAFYPGEPPFQHGGLAKVAGAIAFYIILYPPDALANLIEDCAAGNISIEEVKEWFENHKIILPKKSLE